MSLSNVYSSAWPMIIISFWIKQIVNGCSCPTESIQHGFCSRDFVIMGKVLDETRIPGKEPDPEDNEATWRYSIRLLYAMKGDKLPRVGRKIKIDTPGNEAKCGIRLDIGEKYILSGTFVNNTYTVQLCDWSFDPSRLLPEQIIYFFTSGRYSYKRNCGCEVSFAAAAKKEAKESKDTDEKKKSEEKEESDKNRKEEETNEKKKLEVKPRKDGCVIPTDQRSCYARTAICRQIRGKCTWHNADCENKKK